MKKNNNNKAKRLILALSVFAIFLIGIFTAIFIYFDLQSPDTALIKIPRDASKTTVCDSLSAHLGMKYATRVMTLADISGVDWRSRHGAYKINKGWSALRTMRKLSKGSQTPVKFTFNNIRTANQLASRIADTFDFTPEEFLEELYSKATLDSLNATPEGVVARFFPDTYEFYWTATPKQLIEKLYGYYNQWWTPERLAKAEELGLTTVEIATIASITEEESNSQSERPIIARLYINRLNSGMPLQADPTVKFACKDFAARRITAPMLSTDSPYNTYKYAGLPPGPIRIVEKSTIDNILNAPEHKFLYMCAKEDFSGKHNFTESFSEHKENARRYRAALNARGIH